MAAALGRKNVGLSWWMWYGCWTPLVAMLSVVLLSATVGELEAGTKCAASVESRFMAVDDMLGNRDRYINYKSMGSGTLDCLGMLRQVLSPGRRETYELSCLSECGSGETEYTLDAN